jgi:hypothetical protein
VRQTFLFTWSCSGTGCGSAAWLAAVSKNEPAPSRNRSLCARRSSNSCQGGWEGPAGGRETVTSGYGNQREGVWRTSHAIRGQQGRQRHQRVK